MKFRNSRIRGVFVPLVTPLMTNGRLDKKGFRRLIETLKPKVDGFVPCLSTGEGRFMSLEMWIQTVETVLGISGDMAIIVGIEQSDTSMAISRAKIAKSIGIQTIAVLPPFGGASQEEVYGHFARIAELDIEIVIYNKEMMCGTPIELDTILRLSGIKGIVAIKEGSANPEFTKIVLESVEGISVMQAWDHLLTDVKTHGSIVPLSNLEPELCRKALGDSSKNKEVYETVLRYQLEAENPIWYKNVKAELVRRGIIDNSILIRE